MSTNGHEDWSERAVLYSFWQVTSCYKPLQLHRLPGPPIIRVLFCNIFMPFNYLRLTGGGGWQEAGRVIGTLETMPGGRLAGVRTCNDELGASLYFGFHTTTWVGNERVPLSLTGKRNVKIKKYAHKPRERFWHQISRIKVCSMKKVF